MGVHIDPAWRDQQPIRIDFPLPRTHLPTHLGDFAAFQRDVAGNARCAGTIDNGAASDHGIVH
jgi:hypothetical protein